MALGITRQSILEACEILGITTEADEDAINQAWRNLIRRNHPDMGGDAEKAKNINNAKITLLDQIKTGVPLNQIHDSPSPYSDTEFQTEDIGPDPWEAYLDNNLFDTFGPPNQTPDFNDLDLD